MSLTLSSAAFGPHEAIPSRHTCEGEDVSPALRWSGVPEGTRSLALVVDDPDAPDPAKPQRVWVHWVLAGIPPTQSGLDEGAAPPPGARVGLNDWGKARWGGPCPPIGRHRYFFKLYALDVTLDDLPERFDKKALEAAMQGHVLEQAELVGTYQKKGR